LVLVSCGVLIVLGTTTAWPVIITAASPFVTLSSLLATRTIHWFSWLGIVVLLIVAWRQRWFCRWVCPLGVCADQASWLGRRWGRGRGHWPVVGQWIALLTLIGAAVGYPLLLWLDPLALLSASFSALSAPQTPIAWWFLSGVGAVLLLSLIWPNVWCAKLCPLGGLQDATAAVSAMTVSVIDRRGRRDTPPMRGTPGGIRRRTMLGAIFGVVWASATLRHRRRATGPLRPPGAAKEETFTGLCIRCGNCSRACPTEIITHETGQHGLAGVLTPMIVFQDDYCVETCNQCTVVCPSGALQPVPLEDKIKATMGIAVVDMDVCLLGDDRECSICRNRCPFEAIRLDFSEEFYTLTPVIDPDRCPGCGACQVACPTKPEKAIVVVDV
jgi:MauM/NapG family ferredoxin protein